jgi:riboflavin synthase
MGDPIDGHLIQGHIDGLGRIEEIEKIGENYRWRISLPPSLIRYCPPKGSIAVDGVSLTINRVGENWVELMIIPHTYKVTNFHRYLPGRRVNIETDMIARYLAHILDRTEARAEERSPSRLEWELFHWW